MKHKKLKIALASSIVAVLLAFVTLTVCAYFTTRVYVYTEDGNKEVVHVGMNLQLLFGKLNLAEGTDYYFDIPSYTVESGTDNTSYVQFHDGKLTTEGTTTTDNRVKYNPNAPWGSRENPYILSEPRHLQNLSALHSVGYFDLLYVSSNFDSSGNYIPGSASIPYFLVCTEDGEPIVLDGTGLDPIEPIGSPEHPFIGVIGGAFVDGSATVVNNKTTTVSAIHNFKVTTNTNQTDVGLFGYVGFLGNEPTNEYWKNELAEDPTTPMEFSGVFSSIQDLLISDVSVVVNKPSVVEKFSELFTPFWEAFFGDGDKTVEDGEILHRFSYTDHTGTKPVPHETHHIGIFAGHVSYALIDNISVYYSDDSTYAIDLTGTTANDNYYSASGILGMMFNMNCTIENKTGANCVVKLGTGTSTDEVGTGGAGTGTGGGALSGNGRGYVTAAEIFTDFNNVDVTQSNNELLWKYRFSADGSWVENAILVLKKKDGSYTLLDGQTPVSVSATGVTTTDGSNKSWSKFFVLETYQDDYGKDLYRYIALDNGEFTLVKESELQGNKYNDQIVWKYSAGGDGIWHYGIRVFQSGEGENALYALEDGTSVKIVNGSVATVDGNGNVTANSTYWDCFFITEIVDGTNISYMYDPITGGYLSVTAFERKPMTLIEAVDNDGENLCVEWVSEFLGQTTNTGMYYFYDGVFTFGLSSADDTVRDTWMNNEVPDLYLGANSTDSWEVNPKRGNQAVVAFLTPVTDNATLDAAIAAGKQLYISAKPEQSNPNTLLMMSLVNKNSQDQKYMTAGTLNLDSTIASSVFESYDGGEYTQAPQQPYYDWQQGTLKYRPMMDVEDLKNLWNPTTGKFGNYDVLYIGRTSTDEQLSTLQQTYNVNGKKVTVNNETKYYYFDEDGMPIADPSGTATIPEYRVYNGYLFYIAGNKYGRSFYEIWYQPPKNENGSPEPYRIGGNTDSDWGTGDTINESYIRNILGSENFNDDGLYTGTYGGVTVSGLPVIDYENNRFINGDTAIINGAQVAKQVGTRQYYIHDIVTGKYRSYDGSIVQDSPDNFTGVMLTRYPSYKFADSNANLYLQMGKKTTTKTIEILWGLIKIEFNIGVEYYLWSATDGNGSEGILIFDRTDGSCQLKYSLDDQSQYLDYSYTSASATDNKFVGSNAQEKLYVYVVDGILNMNWGVNTFVPTNLGVANSNTHALPADQYVFWPQTTLKAQHTVTETNADGQQVTTNKNAGVYSNSGPFGTITQTYLNNAFTAASGVSDDPVYSIISLSSLNWGTAEGIGLGDNGGYGLDKKFQMADQSVFGNILNLDRWGLGQLPLGESNMMVAPVGSNGVEATIPKGCVAFRVESGGTQNIRVVVAVPTTDMYFGSKGSESGFGLDLVYDYYIGVWQVEAAGENLSESFDKNAAVEKFELPRSYTYSFEDDPESIDNAGKHYTLVEYDANGDNKITDNERYRTYLNGDCFLVAYEFTIEGNGVYVLGSAHGSSNAASATDVPMEIVHFSVSGTASAGRDGVTGNQLGAIDFVYDDSVGNEAGSNIITVDRTTATGGPVNENGTEDYASYYASQCLLHSNNELTTGTEGNFVNISHARVKIRRYLAGEKTNAKTTISYSVTFNQTEPQVTDAFLVKQYAANSDQVNPTATS